MWYDHIKTIFGDSPWGEVEKTLPEDMLVSPQSLRSFSTKLQHASFGSWANSAQQTVTEKSTKYWEVRLFWCTRYQRVYVLNVNVSDFYACHGKHRQKWFQTEEKASQPHLIMQKIAVIEISWDLKKRWDIYSSVSKYRFSSEFSVPRLRDRFGFESTDSISFLFQSIGSSSSFKSVFRFESSLISRLSSRFKLLTRNWIEPELFHPYSF